MAFTKYAQIISAGVGDREPERLRMKDANNLFPSIIAIFMNE